MPVVTPSFVRRWVDLSELVAVAFRLRLYSPAGSEPINSYYFSEPETMQESLPPFHLAVAVRDLTGAREFYGGLLKCPEGRSAALWVDFNFFGHQLVCHLSDTYPAARCQSSENPVDGHSVPVPHFGVVLAMDDWKTLAGELQKAAIEFVIEPHIRFEGQPGEQATMFLLDPSGNPLEFKAFHDIDRQLFET